MSKKNLIQLQPLQVNLIQHGDSLLLPNESSIPGPL